MLSKAKTRFGRALRSGRLREGAALGARRHRPPRRELELGRGLEIVDERGEKLDVGGDFPDEEDVEYD